MLRTLVIIALVSMLGLSLYGTCVPSAARCHLPGAVGCPGGVLGPMVAFSGSGTQWFDVTMSDWGFYVVDSSTGANVSKAWNVFEGYTVNINATSLPPNTAIGGTAYHGLGIEINATGQQLLSLAAPVGQWVSASFVAPTQPYTHQHIWCTIECGPGHSSQQEYILNIIAPVPLPHATASANVTEGTAPFRVSLTGVGSSGTTPYNFSWNFGDGAPAVAGATAQHTYTLGGIYYASFTVTDAKGNQAQASTTITVLSAATMNATLFALPAGGLAPFGTTFSVVAHGGTPPYTYLWSYGDGAGGLGSNLTHHVYTAPGVYASAVNVTDAVGARARELTSVVVGVASSSLAVTISASPANGTAPFQTTLAATATGGTAPYSYSWVLGDGTAGSGANVGHLYNQTGLYEAVVYASDSAGHAGMAVDPIPVTAIRTGGGGGGGGGGGDTRPLTATPAASTLTVRPLVTPAGGAPPLSVQGIASIQNGTGKNESVTWNFGDGGTATGLVAAHTYATTGSFTVTATATDSGGNAGTGTTAVAVGGPAITLVLNQTAGDTPVSVLAGVTLVGGSGAWGAATWQWGDGATSTGMLLSHTYALNLSGPMTIHATARDAGGNTVTGTATVLLTGPPNASLSVTMPTNNSLPAVVGFTLNVTGGTGGYPAEVLWNFGDLTSTRAPPVVTHRYNSTGHFQVVVETNDSAGHYALASAWVNISSSPQGGGPIGLPPLKGGGPSWVLSGVSDPTRASFVLMGMVAVTGLAFLVRKQRRKATAAKPNAAASARRPTSAKPPTRTPPSG